MIISYQDFINSGLPVSDDIQPAEVEFAVKTIENIIVRPRLGNELYGLIVENKWDYEAEIEGTNTLSGFKFAEYNLVFAYLLVNKYRLTRYSSVIKDDEHSIDVDHKTLLAIGKQYWETGLIALIELEKHFNIENKGIMPNLVFDEYNHYN